MEKSSNFPAAARTNVLMFVFAGLAILVFAAVVYRVENPSIVRHEERAGMPGSEGMEKGGMGEIAAMMKALQDNPGDTDAMRSLGMAFMEMQAWEKALSFWDMTLNATPMDAMALNQKGICLFEQKKYAEAAGQFERMLEVDPVNHHAHFNLGILYKHYLEQPDKATPHFRTVLEANPDDPELLESVRRELGAQ